MIKLADKNACTGCSACKAICPQNAISMVADAEGFLRPSIDDARCVKCGLCTNVCPVLTKMEPRQPLVVYAAKAKDDELRAKSSSGGVFSLLARAVFAEGGIVFGAGFDRNDWHVMHKSAENEEELEDLRGSKYVQSEMGDVFRQVKLELSKNRKVLFTGTPCQIAGLRLFLGKQYDNLLMVDVVCHAAPSPLVWKKYLRERLSAAGYESGGDIPFITKISFRNKKYGWKKFSLFLSFSNSMEYLEDLTKDVFLRGFLLELYNSKSCHDCKCRELKSGSDLTIADYWRVYEKKPEMDDDKGTSLVLVNTCKGELFWQKIEHFLDTAVSSIEDAIRVNPAIVKSPLGNKRREIFFSKLNKTASVDRLVINLLTPPLWKKVLCFIKKILKKVAGK